MESSVRDVQQQPVVAILTMDDEEKGFRGNRENFIDIIATGKEMDVLVYVSTAKDLRLTHRKIVGYTYNQDDNTWTRKLLPLPDVVYNRIPYRKDEQLPEVQQTINECLKHPHVRLYNPFFFNKWSLFEWLKKSRGTKKFIPATRKLTTVLKLGGLLKQYPLLYLKPEKGKAGKGIMRIQRNDSKRLKYQLNIQEGKQSTIHKYADLSGLWNRISEFIGDEEYIVQQGIVLATIGKRPYDLRVLVQKNHKGVWVLTGIGARVAGLLSITTHVPRGGSIDDPGKLLASAFGQRSAKMILVRAKNAALSIARQIEKGSGHVLGEMSMDLGIDAAGHIWFFEANAKPMKFDEPHIRQKSLERMFYYCKYLSKKRKLR